MRTTIWLFIMSAVSILATVPTEAAIRLDLRVEPASQLPAIEPTLRVEATNTGTEAATLPRRVALQVAPSGDRPPFIAFTGLRGDDRVMFFYADGKASIVIAPGETRDVSFWAGPESPTWFAADSRLLSPGTYRFQLVSHANLDSGLLDDLNRAVDQPGMTDPIVSNEATYTVETPANADAAVWELIKQLRTPTLWSDLLGVKIWQEYPNSGYAAYSLRVDDPRDPEVGIAALQATLDKHPSPSWAAWLRLTMAQYEIQRSSRFLSARDVDGAFAAIERAKTILLQLRESGNPYLRKEAQKILDVDIRTRDQLVDYVRRANGEIREVRPFVTCVEAVEGGKHRFWFGYDNTDKAPISIPIGNDNRFTAPPFDRGQPTIFPISKTKLGLQIVTDEPALTWHVDKYNVHASVAQTQPCPADLLERFTYEPPQRN